MAVRQIVPNVAVDRIDEAKVFYGDVLGMKVVMTLDGSQLSPRTAVLHLRSA